MSLLESTAPDFSDPLGLLSACHQRMLGFCELLERLDPWLTAHGIDKDATDSAQRLLRYFNTAGELHHQDEEIDLFPMLSKDDALKSLIDRLRAEHRELEQHWAALASELEGLLKGRHRQAELHNALVPFCAAYRRHIHDEEHELLAQAKSLLDREQLRRLGESMAARRRPGGVSPTE